MKGLLDLLFPPWCLACGRVLEADGFFCEACEPTVSPLPEERCARCAEPGTFAQRTCPRCVLRPPAFSRVVAPFAHEGAIARAVHLFKYEDRPELALPLAKRVWRDVADALAGGPDTVTAIPLHATRFRERKYDQAHLLAVELGRLGGLRYLPNALLRTRATARQVGLVESAREENVRGAFRADGVRDLRVLLVDDVFTTGATARAAADALLEAGAEEVWVLAVARAFAGASG